jgi:hypothetical protein
MRRSPPIAATLAAALLAACAGDPSAPNEPAPAAELRTIELSAAEALGWSYRHQLAADVDGDGAPETVVLACDVVVTPEGRVLWEDGHRWAVVVRDGELATLAYAAFVPHGFVEAAVLRPAAEGGREILLRERTPDRVRDLWLAYPRPGEARAASAAYSSVESWLPGSATPPDRLRASAPVASP